MPGASLTCSICHSPFICPGCGKDTMLELNEVVPKTKHPIYHCYSCDRVTTAPKCKCSRRRVTHNAQEA